MRYQSSSYHRELTYKENATLYLSRSLQPRLQLLDLNDIKSHVEVLKGS